MQCYNLQHDMAPTISNSRVPKGAAVDAHKGRHVLIGHIVSIALYTSSSFSSVDAEAHTCTDLGLRQTLLLRAGPVVICTSFLKEQVAYDAVHECIHLGLPSKVCDFVSLVWQLKHLHWDVPVLHTEQLKAGVCGLAGLGVPIYLDCHIVALGMPEHCDLCSTENSLFSCMPLLQLFDSYSV